VHSVAALPVQLVQVAWQVTQRLPIKEEPEGQVMHSVTAGPLQVLQEA
jgi:hypothetical protein